MNTFTEETLNRKLHFLCSVHAMSGCDTTSAPFGKGKSSFLALLKKPDILQRLPDTTSGAWADQDEIGLASIETFVMMYGSKKNYTLGK